jgi:citrate lyase subunit beta/citryl-CoA lyase
MRSKLFVPGTRPELFAKALAGEADAISFDLEDAVPEPGKAAAREHVAAFLRSEAARASRKLLIVRVNAADTPYFAADIEAFAGAGLDLINLPKVESPESVRSAVALIAAAERAARAETATPLLLTIETPRGLRDAAAIAAADRRVAGLQLGLADLFEPYGIARDDVPNVHAAMFALRIAAAEAGVFAYDAAFADAADPQGYAAEAAMARRLGFLGKTCIHPRQVALANAAFQPDEAEVAQARRILAAAQSAAGRGSGAFVVDGRMIDRPFLKRAEAVVAAALARAATS